MLSSGGTLSRIRDYSSRTLRRAITRLARVLPDTRQCRLPGVNETRNERRPEGKECWRKREKKHFRSYHDDRHLNHQPERNTQRIPFLVLAGHLMLRPVRPPAGLVVRRHDSLGAVPRRCQRAFTRGMAGIRYPGTVSGNAAMPSFAIGPRFCFVAQVGAGLRGCGKHEMRDYDRD